jgi:hypothetical protein
MTKERATVPQRVVIVPKRFFITFGGPHAHDSSGRHDKFVELRQAVHRLEKRQFTQNNFVISTGAKRSGEICGFFCLLAG